MARRTVCIWMGSGTAARVVSQSVGRIAFAAPVPRELLENCPLRRSWWHPRGVACASGDLADRLTHVVRRVELLHRQVLERLTDLVVGAARLGVLDEGCLSIG